MKIGIDIGGVLSKYPEQFKELIEILTKAGAEVFIITDMHDRDKTLKMLSDNEVDIPPDKVFNSDYDQYGELCKAIIVSQIGIDIFIDDFPGYLVWDSALGQAPIRLLVQPDPFTPYWSYSWKTEPGDDFGRRVSVLPQEI